MSDPLLNMLVCVDEIAKQNLIPEIVCPTCGERHCFIKHGFYLRYQFAGDGMVKIQRYRCLNIDCPRCTFSCLPHPFLPIIRLPLCALLAILAMVENNSATIAAASRAWHRSWASIKRALHIARRLRRFMQAQAHAASWAPSPCLDPARHWGAFSRAFSFAFYPQRF
jgi:hypothetical protein